MCRLLAELTQTDTRMMSETIRRLEHKSGLPAVDIRLTAHIHAQIHLKIRALGLDPHDTTPKELYAALQNLAAVHDGFLKKKFHLSQWAAPENFAEDVQFIFERLRFNRRSWLLKPSVIRRILRQHSPKTLIKSLGYRTAESMVKRESPEVILFLALQMESNTWLQQLEKHLKTVSSADFEERLIEVRALDDPRYAEVAHQLAVKYHTFVFSTPLVGSIFVFQPSVAIMPGTLLLAVLMTLREVTELQAAHSQLRHYQMDGSFGQKLMDTLHQRNQKTASVAGHPFDWRLIHRHYGSGSVESHPLIFQPHLQPEDMAYRRAEEILYRVEPALHFWHGIEFVGLPTQAGIISFNLLDVLMNLVNGVSLERRRDSHLGPALWDELLLRYMHQPAIEADLLGNLASQDEQPHHLVRDMEFV